MPDVVGAPTRAVGRLRHVAEEQLWRTRSGMRWLLRRDLRILDDFRSVDRGGEFAEVERSLFSQNGEDGILAHIFASLGVHTGTFLEIGAADGEQNCTRALAEAGWSGYWVEGDPALVAHARGLELDGRVHVEHALVAPSSVGQLLRSMGVPGRLDLISLDIDSCDYWVMRELLRDVVATVIVVEINGEHPWPWVLPLRQGTGPGARQWDQSWNYGASLGAYDALLAHRGYSLVGCDSHGVNAFFVRTESLVPGLRTGDWRSFYRPPSHRPGTLGHPRRSPASGEDSAVGSPIALDRVGLGGIELIGEQPRRVGDRVLLVVDLHNRSGAVLASAGEHPVRLSFRILRVGDGCDVTPPEPQRSRLASPIAPGATRASGLEVVLPESAGEYLVVPTLVQEGIAWRESDPTEGLLVAVCS
ncbi:MAG: hypothetical protein V9E94_08765 [Microthrixaceae bacterium]